MRIGCGDKFKDKPGGYIHEARIKCEKTEEARLLRPRWKRIASHSISLQSLLVMGIISCRYFFPTRWDAPERTWDRQHIGVNENIALFHVKIPLQVDWPYGFRQPPLIVDAPDKVPMHLNTYFANISRCERKILARIEYDVDDKSIRCEANAINLMNNVKDASSAAEWW